MTASERLKTIRKEDVLAAMQRIDEEGVPSRRKSETYDVVYQGKTYPLKYVLSLAGFFSPKRQFILSKWFHGGENTQGNKYLKELGFELARKDEENGEPPTEKKDNIHYKYVNHEIDEELNEERFHKSFRAYLDHCKSTDWLEYRENYKFKFGRWLNERVDFDKQTDEEILEICRESQEQKYDSKTKGVNFILSSRRFQDEFIALDDIRKIRNLQEGGLLDEYDLRDSPLSFPKFSVWAATLLPEKFMTIANQKLLDGLVFLFEFENIPKRGVRNFNLVNTAMRKLVIAIREHYEKEVNTLLNNKLNTDGPLKAVDWVWLSQDYLLYMIHEYLSNEPNYWIFQSDPEQYDIQTALRENILESWYVTDHKDNIQAGDKVIVWMTGEEAGCYALGEVNAPPEENVQTSDDHLWKTTDNNQLKTKIKITHNLLESPILENMINEDSMENLKAGKQGFNFEATKEQYQTLMDMIEDNSNNDFEKTLSYFREEDLEIYFGFLKEIIDRNNISKGATQLCYNYNATSLRLTVGQRMAWYLEGKGEKQPAQFFVLSKEKLNNESRQFDGNTPRPFYTRMDSFNPNSDQLKSIHEGISREYNRTEKSGYRIHHKEVFENYVYSRLYPAKNAIAMAQNIILYGPPGTGKTYCLKEEYFDRYTSSETSLSKEEHFEEIVRDLTWWQVVAIALIELGEVRVTDIVNNRWVAKKTGMSKSENIRPTIWGTLQMHTVQESKSVGYTQRQPPLIFDKKEDKSWKIIESEVQEQAPELYDIIEKAKNFNPQPDNLIKRYVFSTFHQSYSYEDFIEGIKPVMGDGENETEGAVNYRIEDGVFKKLCLRADSDPNNRYAIFIDEINRGNVSAIFGELISLIEPDKRKGQINQLPATLPYSKKIFTVPSNVDIIATMNTADRSVEALDTALRRRFSFVEIMPNPHLLRSKGENGSGTVDGIDLEELLSIINERIEVLVDRDHTIGHAYFMEVNNTEDLRGVFKNKIIPLLQEYFYGDYAKMEMVIGPKYFEKKSVEKVSFATLSDDYLPEGYVYQIVDVEDSEFDIEKAINRLLNKTKEV